MDIFARCFLLVFAQLYVGGVLTLSIPPFHGIERGFYKSTAGVYLGFGLLVLIGRVALLLHPPMQAAPTTTAEIVELVLWTLSVSGGGLYLYTLWGEPFELRARAYVAAWGFGTLALLIGAQTFRPGPFLSIETIVYPFSFLVSALLLGAVTTGMLLGHWYLIDSGLTLEPFWRVLRFFVAMLALQAGLMVVVTGLLSVVGTPESVRGLTQLLSEHRLLLVVRVLLSPAGAACLAWMIWKTLKIPQTMAATGLFYIAILAVLVGEMMSRFILFRTTLPL
ncbi:MAG: hypothetical protein HY270_00585 [Deltaproteobacteria bacterium]|nr:hypothetical protein [Deltaproteobacteria bacterium]